MKKILTIAALLIGYFTYAIGPVTYYVKFGGNDAANGLSDINAWGTIAKVNGFTFATGDTIKFKKGDSFYGSIVVPVGNLVFDAYGTGAQPLITGFTTLSGWTNAGGGVWNIYAPAVKNTVNMVTLNGVAQEVGRYPNSDAANGGYLTDDTYSGNTQLTCAALNAGTNWTGAEVVTRVRGYIVERNTITAQTAGTITYAPTITRINPRNDATSPSPTTPPAVGFGLFIQRDIRTLDKLGEWYFNTSTKVMSMFFGAGNPTSYTIKASTVDTLINGFNKSNLTINNIAFEGANLAAIYFVDGTNRTITNCTINNSGAKGIFGWASANTFVDNNTVSNSMTGAVDIRSNGGANNVTVTNNTVTNTGMLKGMSSFYDPADCNAFYIEVGNTERVALNSIDSSGYIGIHYGGNGGNIDSNFINHYCQQRNDGGGIYAYLNYTSGSNIRNNIIINAGNPVQGTQEQVGTHGIYMDGGQGGVNILNNTVANLPSTNTFGLFFNSPKNITANYNTVYNGNGWYDGRQYYDAQYGFVLKHNIIFNTASSQSIMQHTHSNLTTTTTYTSTGIQNDLQQLGAIDSSYYNSSNATPFSWYYASTTNNVFDNFPAPVSFATWKTYTGLDAHTVSSNFSAYQLVTNPTNNSVVNSFTGFSKKDVFGTVYNNSATIPAWSSKVLIDNGTTVTGTPPTVNPGSPDITITLPTNSVTMAGSATAGTAAIASNTWFRSYGPMTYTITNPANYNTTITGLVAGFYNFSLTVTDINGLSATGIRGVQVNPANIIPVANIAGVANITLPVSTVTLNGTGSTDADGTIVSYAWTKVSGPATYTIVSPTGSTTAVNSLVAGTYTFQLIVTDNVGAASIPATVTFTVNPAIVVTGCTNCIITNQIPKN